MTLRRTAVFFTLLLLTISCSAQNNLRALERTWHGKSMPLRSFSADPVVTYNWINGSTLALQPVTVHTLGLFITQNMQMADGKITILGMRETVVAGQNKKAAQAARVPMKIEINFASADPNDILPLLQDTLFFAGTDAAASYLPDDVAKLFPWDGHVTPEPLKTAGPALNVPMTAAARAGHAPGSAIFSFFVDSDGSVKDLWLARPAGFGLDEAAEDALLHAKLQPAAAGQTAPTRVVTEIAFTN